MVAVPEVSGRVGAGPGDGGELEGRKHIFIPGTPYRRGTRAVLEASKKPLLHQRSRGDYDAGYRKSWDRQFGISTSFPTPWPIWAGPKRLARPFPDSINSCISPRSRPGRAPAPPCGHLQVYPLLDLACRQKVHYSPRVLYLDATASGGGIVPKCPMAFRCGIPLPMSRVRWRNFQLCKGDRREENVSALQCAAQADPWVPGPHGHARRACSAFSPAAQRPPSPDRVMQRRP